MELSIKKTAERQTVKPQQATKLWQTSVAEFASGGGGWGGAGGGRAAPQMPLFRSLHVRR